ncbi:beta-ketoacyl reductase, partial [Myxococcota bacterium]|nr:beta-ketoacyl reductase [Myxococcota bacterium]
LDELERRGTRVRVELADVADRAAITRIVAAIGARLTGVFHLAGVLDDGLVAEQTLARFEAVMAPKIAGAWNLHEATKALPLELFVLFGSAASVLGSPGQSNYAAANAFLGALAAHRRGLGLAATSLEWGPWESVGLVAGERHQARFEALGLGVFSPERGVALLEEAIALDHADLAIVALDPAKLAARNAAYARASASPFLSELVALRATPERPSATGDGARARIAALPAGERLRAVEHLLTEEVAAVLRLDARSIDPDAPMQSLGLDSLMALELRNRLEQAVAVKLSATMIWRYPTIGRLAAHVLEAAHLDESAPAAPPTPAASSTPEPAAALTDAEGQELLALLDALKS